ncbi:MAG: T9SS type A sorting domain-containing protein, partial [Bacteroidota bacterium]
AKLRGAEDYVAILIEAIKVNSALDGANDDQNYFDFSFKYFGEEAPDNPDDSTGGEVVLQLGEEPGMRTLQVYPNPVQDHLQVESAEKRIGRMEVYNVLNDRVLWTEGEGAPSQILDVSALPAGWYVVVVSFADGSAEARRLQKW